MIPRLARQLWWRRYLSRNARPWDELEEFPRLAPAQQRRTLAQKLLDQVRYFGSQEFALPEWREAARITDPEELWRVWPSLPVVDKKLLQGRFSPYAIRQSIPLEGVIDSTGGSTGEPTHFFHDNLMRRTNLALGMYTRRLMGWKLGMPAICVWGSERDIGKELYWKNRLNGWLLADFMVDGYHLSDFTVDRVLYLIRKYRPVALFGFTSMLEFVARRVVESGRQPEPGAVATAWNGGEMLFPEQSQVFAQAFGAPILNRYGGRELSDVACQSEPGGPLHVMRPWVFLEVVDERGRPVAAGQTGRMLWTSTVCRGTPFLRYDVGDLGVFDAAQESESGIGALREIQGRVASLLRLPDGREINNIYWNHLFKEFREVLQFQVILRRNGAIRILLVGDAQARQREGAMRSKLSHLLDTLPVELRWVEEITPTAQGKRIQVLREET
jgi:phenylacetate-CoA ligase